MRIVFYAILIAFLCSNSTVSFSNPICHLSTPVIESYIDLKKIERPTGTVNIKAILVICDHYITPENNKIAQSLRVDLATVSQMLDIIEKRNIAKVHKTVIDGSNATLDNILKSLNAIQTEKDDVILYYFSGHGFMENGKTFMLSADEKNLSREKVASIIGSKNARLKMLISDCCSNSIDEVTVSRSINRSGQKIEAGEFDPIYKDLFLGYEGTMHLNAATEGEKAFSNSIEGGFFTYHLIKEGLIKKPVNNWTDIFEMAKNKTSQMFMRMDAEDKAILAKEGIKNQTAKAYSLPVPKSVMKSPNPSNNTSSSVKINIYNYTNFEFSVFIDNNDPSAEWLESNTKIIAIPSGSNISINQKQALVGYEYKGRDYYFELGLGDYFLAIDDVGSCEMFIKDADINKNNFSSIAIKDYNTLLIGKWLWYDADVEVVTTFKTNGFTDEYSDEANDERGIWSVRKQEIDGYEYNFVTLEYNDDGSTLLLDYLLDYDEEFSDEILLVFISAFEDGQEIPYEEAEEFLEPSIVLYKIQ